jgi:hypothetical protein
MATDEETKALAPRDEHASARAMFDVLLALQEVGKAELSKGSGIASVAWRKLVDVIGEGFGEEPLPHATPVVGRQPSFMPRWKNPPAKSGATPTQPGQGVQETAADIRKRDDVAAELARVKRGGKT